MQVCVFCGFGAHSDDPGEAYDGCLSNLASFYSKATAGMLDSFTKAEAIVRLSGFGKGASNEAVSHRHREKQR